MLPKTSYLILKIKKIGKNSQWNNKSNSKLIAKTKSITEKLNFYFNQAALFQVKALIIKTPCQLWRAIRTGKKMNSNSVVPAPKVSTVIEFD